MSQTPQFETRKPPMQHKQEDRGTPFRILSLDGGGCRGVLEPLILARLLQFHPTLLDEVDMFAGTSAGSIIAFAYAVGMTNEESLNLIKNQCKIVFARHPLRKFEALGSAIKAAFPNETLRKLLTDQFKGTKLKDVQRKVLVTSFKLDNEGKREVFVHDGATTSSQTIPIPRRWAPKFFHNMRDSREMETTIVDLCLRSSAAPTYFPVYQGYVDGGVFANNPALCAVSTAMANGIKRKDIVVLSLSTGKDGIYIDSEHIQKHDDGDWGLAQWALKLADMMLDSTMEMTDFQCMQMLGTNFHRIDPDLGRNIPIDDPNVVPQLEQIAKRVELVPTLQWLVDVWKTGTPRRTANPHDKFYTDVSPAMERRKPSQYATDDNVTKSRVCTIQ
eukprot:TRINITY_DN5452_c1_g1_i1.p1 TRINITY_DN5452_c1_g1~~TRINITY_DN5452_c1_g1_i1.p1  ORF type:complete len:388 (-),score=83.46 TRINITY_DN5452_c1_g1_i1:167-1330(-)